MLADYAEALPYRVGVEIEDRTNAFKGVRPVGVVGEKPLLRLVEEPATVTVRGGAIPGETIERVVKDGSHDPVFGCRFALRSDVLRRQDAVEL